MSAQAVLSAEHCTVAYGKRIIQRDLNFAVGKGDIFIIMGGSGCGKSSLLRVLMGLLPPAEGKIFYGDTDFWAQPPSGRDALMRRCGVLFQSGALWSSRTLAENICLPIERYTGISRAHAMEIASFKLAQVGLSGFENYYPSEISGGMRKRAGLARALALDPEIVFFDDPSAGLDPISAAQLDELILSLRDSLGMTVLIVTHELASIFAIGSNSVWLDAETKTALAGGDPKELVRSGPEKVRAFLRRGKKDTGD